jgi:D-xylose transport system permease protein
MSSQDKKFLSGLLALLLLVLFFAVSTEGVFIQGRNLSNLLRQTSINGILAVGMTYVLLLGAVDLSVGSMTAVLGVLVALSQGPWGWGSEGWAGALKSIALVGASGIALGAFNGAWIAGLRIHSFVITLGMMVIARGLALIFSGGSNISPVGPELASVGAGYLPGSIAAGAAVLGAVVLCVLGMRAYAREKAALGYADKAALIVRLATVVGGALLLVYVSLSYQGLPMPVLLLALVAGLGIWVLDRTRYGRAVYALGDNPQAARLAGIRIGMVTLGVFTLTGLLSALSGLVLTSRLNGASPTAGALFELDAIAACVIGGTSLKGGRGSVRGSLLGALIIESLNNGMSLMNVHEYFQMPLKGLIVIFAVALDSVLDKRREAA